MTGELNPSQLVLYTVILMLSIGNFLLGYVVLYHYMDDRKSRQTSI